jgi:hypothetical protein
MQHGLSFRPGNPLDKAASLCHNWHIMSTGETEQPEPLFWMGSTHQDLKAFPAEVRQAVGFALFVEEGHQDTAGRA